MPSNVTCYSPNCEYCLSNLCTKEQIDLSQSARCLAYSHKEHERKDLKQCKTCKNHNLFSVSPSYYKPYCKLGYDTNILIGNPCWEDK